MNKIWTFIIIFSIIFSIITNNFTNLINALFDVPETSLKLLFSLGGLIIIYNGLFQIAIDCDLINYISFLFKPFIKRIYKNTTKELLDLLCANFVANLLGLGIASTPIAIKAIQKINNEKHLNKLICFNISCFTLLPFTILTLRNKLGGINNFKILIFLIIITFMSTIFSHIITNIGEHK